VYAGVLSRHLSSWMMDVRVAGHSVGFLIRPLLVFLSVSKNDADIILRIFCSNCFEWLSLAWEFTSLSSGAQRFLSTNISQGSV